jgi:membrane protein YqaA with SNARE-associated domain
MSIYIVFAFPGHILDLLFYFTYMAAACTFFPLPTPQVVIDYAQRYGSMQYGLVLIALLGGIAFCISALIDYSMVTLALRNGKIGKIKETRTYRYVERFFHKCPFVILMVAAFTPIPLEPVKLIACASRYRRAKFLLACFVGRTSRYYLLGKFVGNIPREYLYGSIVVLVMIEVIRRLVKRLWQWRATGITSREAF